MALTVEHAIKKLYPWLVLGGICLIVLILARASALLIPLAIATLFAFLLSPLVTFLERRIGRLAAVILVLLGSMAVAGELLFLGGRELTDLANDLPGYRDTIQERLSGLRGMTESGGIFAKLDEMLGDIQTSLQERTNAQEVVLQQSATDTASTLSAAFAPVLGLIADAGIVLVLVTFMLFERRLLRDRLMRLVGHHRLATTTKTIDEAGHRISRYLLVQLAVNTFYGVVIGLGLYLIGLPHALFWGSVATILRFVPYIGPWLAAIPPILLSLAVTPGWLIPITVISLYVGLELFTNLVLETHLYAGVAGISQVGLLIAVLFWSWLWGPAGLLLAAPLTVCLVVIGKHLPALRSFSDLMADDVSTDISGRYYQRLLAEDQLEAADIIEQHAAVNGTDSVFDALMLPALNFAERDVASGVLVADEEKALQTRTEELLADLIGMQARPTANLAVSSPRSLVIATDGSNV